MNKGLGGLLLLRKRLQEAAEEIVAEEDCRESLLTNG
jgi:hypothetical protein